MDWLLTDLAHGPPVRLAHEADLTGTQNHASAASGAEKLSSAASARVNGHEGPEDGALRGPAWLAPHHAVTPQHDEERSGRIRTGVLAILETARVDLCATPRPVVDPMCPAATCQPDTTKLHLAVEQGRKPTSSTMS